MTTPTNEELDALHGRAKLFACNIGASHQTLMLVGDLDSAITALRERLAELERVPVAEEVEAMAINVERRFPVELMTAAAAMLRSLSRQIAAKDGEIARLQFGRDIIEDRLQLLQRAQRAEAELAAAQIREEAYREDEAALAAVTRERDTVLSNAKFLLAETTRLEAEVAALRQDAARYRWLRSSDYEYVMDGASGDHLDAAVDAALAAKAGGT